MNKRPVTLEEMRAIQLEILDSVHAFCMERGLRYSLGGGTLLGAVRHKGYIPWDDDIDIMMPRPDYERFIREFPGTKGNLSIQNYHNDPHCYLMFSKVYDNRTVLEEDIMLRNGVAIDVFAVDGLPDEEKIHTYVSKLNEYYLDVIRMTRLYRFTPWQHFKLFIKKLIRTSRADNIKNIERLLSTYEFDTSDYAGAVTGVYGEKEHMPASSFQKYIPLSFEGREFMAIADYDLYLTKHYGDYMKLPPIEKRKSHHPYKAWWK